MNSSSPAHSSVSTTAIVGGSANNTDLAADGSHFPSDLISVQYRKDEAMLVLKSDLMAAFNKEVKSLEEDSWKFEGPRSRIHLISRPVSNSMGSRRHVQMSIFLTVGILMVFCFNTLVSGLEDSSDRSEVETFGGDKSNMKTKKYIMESYFERYDSLVDSSFEEFIANEFPLSLCKVPSDNVNLGLRPSDLHRYLDGEGSHRRLSSSIRFDIMPEALTEFSGRMFEVVIIERLPSGVFADPFELQHLLERGVFTDVAVYGETNLELPTVVTNRSAVEIHMNVESKTLHNKNGLEIKIELPLHSRYPPLDDSGYAEVRFDSPDIFMRCSTKHGNSHSESCLLYPAKDGTGLKTDGVVWRVAAGREADARVVSVVTFVSALFSTLVIVWTSIYHSGSKTIKKS